MRSIIKATSLIATSTLWIASVAVAIPAEPILAAPQRVLTNGVHALCLSPGLGIELELTTLTYKSIEEKWNQIKTTEREALKGARLIPTGFAGGPQTNWNVTAEISPANLMTEVIINGRNNKVSGDNDAIRRNG